MIKDALKFINIILCLGMLMTVMGILEIVYETIMFRGHLLISGSPAKLIGLLGVGVGLIFLFVGVRIGIRNIKRKSK